MASKKQPPSGRPAWHADWCPEKSRLESHAECSKLVGSYAPQGREVQYWVIKPAGQPAEIEVRIRVAKGEVKLRFNAELAFEAHRLGGEALDLILRSD
jgi:hypothetical protein